MFDIGHGRVLRRYRQPGDPRREAAVMEHARAHGYPVPAVHDATGTDLVMERVDGPSMLEDLLRRPWRLGRQARTLVDLHGRLHAIPPPGGLPAPFGEGPALLHLDLHPVNVLLSARGPMVIDWAAAARGPSEADIAQTWVILHSSVIPGRWLLLRPVRSLFLRTFLAGFDPRSVRAILPAVARRRLQDPNVLDAERARILGLMARVEQGRSARR